MRVRSSIRIGLALAGILGSSTFAAREGAIQTSNNVQVAMSASANGSAGRGTASSTVRTQESAGRGRRIVLPPNSFTYILPKSATRARINRNRQLSRAPAVNPPQTGQNGSGVGAGAVVVGANGEVPPAHDIVPEAGGSGFVPTFAPTPSSARPVNPTLNPNPSLNRIAIRPAAPVVRSPAKAEVPPVEKALPISVARGPAFDDRDPLLGYQQEQAAKGNPESQYAMGVRHLTGNGVVQDEGLAREWLEKASANGNLRARTKLRELKSIYQERAANP
jgi:hypothetical protein